MLDSSGVQRFLQAVSCVPGGPIPLLSSTRTREIRICPHLLESRPLPTETPVCLFCTNTRPNKQQDATKSPEAKQDDIKTPPGKLPGSKQSKKREAESSAKDPPPGKQPRGKERSPLEQQLTKAATMKKRYDQALSKASQLEHLIANDSSWAWAHAQSRDLVQSKKDLEGART
eukprot:15477823-Alexandrium_andersonii.AAC.1